jgi:mRNA interferase RelE/StbE
VPARYQILRHRHFDKDLVGIPADQHDAIRAAINSLGDDPRLLGSKRLQGQRRGENFRRLRVGRYRVIYDVDDAARVVRIVLVGLRRDVYERFKRR